MKNTSLSTYTVLGLVALIFSLVLFEEIFKWAGLVLAFVLLIIGLSRRLSEKNRLP